MSPTSSSTDHPRPAWTTLDRPKPKGAWFDEVAADKAVTFFSKLPHIKGRWAGQAFMLEPWQAHEVIRPLFGWRRADGTRLYRELYLEIPRKNGKSTLSAGIAGLLTFADGEPGAEVFSAAVDREQAAIVFDALKEMVLATPVLADPKRTHVFRRSVTFRQRSGATASYRVLSADAKTKHGLNAHGAVVDELHAHPTRELFDVLSTSTGSRQQPLVVSITTAGVWSPSSICWEKHEYTQQIVKGILHDDAFLGVIYAAEPEDDWTDPETWRKANPNYGVSISHEYLERECAKAKASVAAQNTFRQLHLNQWTQQATRWIDLGLWDVGRGLVVWPDLSGEVLAGLDLASVSDLTAWMMVFPGPHECHEDCVKVFGRYFVPEEAVAKRPMYQQFLDWDPTRFIVTPGAATDYAFVRQAIRKDAERFYVSNLNLDYLFQGGQLAGELLADGLPVNAFRNQGYTAWALPMKKFEQLLLEGKIHHGGDPVMRWAADNVVVKRDPDGNLRPDKDKSADKIDPVVAFVMALEPLTRERFADPQAVVL